MNNYLTDNEICLQDFDSAIALQKILLDNGYVVMISREEEFWIVNWIWDPDDLANRNAVIFYSREDYEYELYKEQQEREKEDDTDN